MPVAHDQPPSRHSPIFGMYVQKGSDGGMVHPASSPPSGRMMGEHAGTPPSLLQHTPCTQSKPVSGDWPESWSHLYGPTSSGGVKHAARNPSPTPAPNASQLKAFTC